MDEFDEKVDQLLHWLSDWHKRQTIYSYTWETDRVEFRRLIRETILAFNSLPLVDDGS